MNAKQVVIGIAVLIAFYAMYGIACGSMVLRDIIVLKALLN